MFSQLARHVSRTRPVLQAQQLRFLNVHEYQVMTYHAVPTSMPCNPTMRGSPAQ
jgi:hypothetical protein